MVQFSDSSKVVVVGSSECGKSAFVSRLVNNDFPSQYVQTIGAELFTKTVSIQDKKTLLIDIWSCSGQSRYAVLFDQFLQSAQVAIICFDLTSTASFQETKFWYTRLKTISPDTKILLLGLKCDLSDKIQVQEKDILTTAKEWNADYFPVSSRTETNFSQFSAKLVQILH